jgi:hypothetical protein
VDDEWGSDDIVLSDAESVEERIAKPTGALKKTVKAVGRAKEVGEVLVPVKPPGERPDSRPRTVRGSALEDSSDEEEGGVGGGGGGKRVRTRKPAPSDSDSDANPTIEKKAKKKKVTKNPNVEKEKGPAVVPAGPRSQKRIGTDNAHLELQIKLKPKKERDPHYPGKERDKPKMTTRVGDISSPRLMEMQQQRTGREVPLQTNPHLNLPHLYQSQ